MATTIITKHGYAKNIFDVPLAEGELAIGFDDDKAAAELYVGNGTDKVQINLKGEKGETGQTGPTGPQGLTGPTGAKGADGKNGTNGTSAAWFTGTAMSGTGTKSVNVSGAKAGDMYLNTMTADVYKASSASSWTYQCNIRGVTGPQGATGSTGSTGPAGASGKDGTNGTSAAWFTGTGMSGTGTKTYSVSGAKAGDMYLNTSTADVYKASSASSWTWQCNIRGATGPAGPTGPQGPTGSQGPQGPAGPNTVGTTTATNISGMLKGNGSNVVAAVKGTDYLAPDSNIDGGTF